MEQEIELGDKVRCIHTGFEGTAVCKLEFINGCIQWSILPKLDKKSKTMKEGIMPDEVSIDSKSLKIVTKKKKPVEKKVLGGPMRRDIRQRGF